MRTHPHLLGRHGRCLVAVILTAALLAPGAASAAQRTFSAGSLIIPASIEYQSDDGVLGTYAMVYVALHLNAKRVAEGKKKISYYWAVQPSKLSQYRCNTATDDLPKYSPTYNDNDGCDFAVQYASGQPVSLVTASGALQAPFSIWNVGYKATVGPERATTQHAINNGSKVVKYLGGAWIVDAVDRQEFLKMLAEEPQLARFHANGTGSANFVNIHSANAAFRAPVASIIVEKPKRIAVTGSTEYPYLVNVLVNAGLCQADTIPNCVGEFDPAGFASGVVLDHYADGAELLEDKVPGCRVVGPTTHGSRLNCEVNGALYGLLWASNSTAAYSAAAVTNLSTFLQVRGNAAYFQYDAVNEIEDVARYKTTTGIGDFKPDVNSAEDCNDQALPAGSKFRSTGGPCLVLAGANQPWAQTGNFVFDGGQGSFKAFSLAAGGAFNVGVTQITQVKTGVTTGPTVASAWYKDNDPEKGLVLYLAGHKFDNDRLWGERLILNTLFAALDVPGIELARSEPVGYKNTRATPNTVRVYQGTYVQKPMPDSNDVITYNPGAAQMWKFPYTVGHLYEHDVTDLATTAQAFGANKNWDASAFGIAPHLGIVPAPARRQLHTYVGGSGNLGWTRIPFHHAETGTSCTDTDGNKKCDLSELLALGNSAGGDHRRAQGEGGRQSLAGRDARAPRLAGARPLLGARPRGRRHADPRAGGQRVRSHLPEQRREARRHRPLHAGHRRPEPLRHRRDLREPAGRRLRGRAGRHAPRLLRLEHRGELVGGRHAAPRGRRRRPGALGHRAARPDPAPRVQRRDGGRHRQRRRRVRKLPVRPERRRRHRLERRDRPVARRAAERDPALAHGAHRVRGGGAERRLLVPRRLGAVRARRDEPAPPRPPLARGRADRGGRPLGRGRRRQVRGGRGLRIPPIPRPSRSSGPTTPTSTTTRRTRPRSPG